MTQRKGHRSRKCAFWNSYLPNLIGMIFFNYMIHVINIIIYTYIYGGVIPSTIHIYISLQKIVRHLTAKMVSVHWRTVLQLKRLSHAPSL